MSFLLGRSSVSFGGPDEDFTGREVSCCRPDGTEIGTAVLLEQIAFAGFSHVYKAFISGAELEGRVVAAKVLTTGYTHSATKAEPLLKRLYDRELAALKAVQHDHVIELLGVGEVSMQPDSPEHDTPTHAANMLATPSIDEHDLGPHMMAALPMLESSVRGGTAGILTPAGDSDHSNPAITGGAFGSMSSLALQRPHSRTNSYTMAPFLTSHHKPATPGGGGAGMSRLQSMGSGALRMSPSHPAPVVPGRVHAMSSTGVQPPSPAHHISFQTHSMDPTSYLDKSLSGQPDTPPGHTSASGNTSGIPGTPQHPTSVLFAKQGSFRQSFLNRVNQHRPMPSLTFSTRRSITSASGNCGTRRVLFIQWMSGGDARTLIDQAMRPMEEQAAATIMLPIAQALGAAHKAGIVHRDVKAGNILLAPGPRQVRLADWGISVHEAESSSRMSNNGGVVRAPGAVGTEYWCAPEIELGHAHDQKSDLFSLAITFIELVTGKDPKYDNSVLGFGKITERTTGLIPDFLSEEALEWLVPCLSINPAERPTIATLLAHPYFLATLARMEQEEADMMAEDDHEEVTLAGNLSGEDDGLMIPVGVMRDSDDGGAGTAPALGGAAATIEGGSSGGGARRGAGGPAVSRLVNNTLLSSELSGGGSVQGTLSMSKGGAGGNGGLQQQVAGSVGGGSSAGGAAGTGGAKGSLASLRIAINNSASRHSQGVPGSEGGAGGLSSLGNSVQQQRAGSKVPPGSISVHGVSSNLGRSVGGGSQKAAQEAADAETFGTAPYLVDEPVGADVQPRCGGCVLS